MHTCSAHHLKKSFVGGESWRKQVESDEIDNDNDNAMPCGCMCLSASRCTCVTSNKRSKV